MKIERMLMATAVVALGACSSEKSTSDTSGAEKTAKTAKGAASKPAAAATESAKEAMGGGDIVEVAMAAGRFKTLATALDKAGLVETLKGEGPFTVFAPTDEAFSKLPEGTLDSLLKPDNKEKLAKILSYHVVPGKVPSSKVTTMSEAKTVAGPAIDIAVEEGKVMLNDKATVTETDIEAKNGVIHVIDSVILPPE